MIKSGKLRIKKIQIFLKALIKIEKAIKFSDTEIQKQKFHQHKETTSTKNIDLIK